jgi:hypothetical protein
MKYHIISALCLVVALLFYAAGLAGAGFAVFLWGAAFELFFWGRVIIKLKASRSDPPHGTRETRV